MDHSNGYEKIAAGFIKARSNSIGVAEVIRWSETLPTGTEILELGCGAGIPVSAALIDRHFRIFGVDASETLAKEFNRNFPDSNIQCDSVETSDFYGRDFDAILAWGLMFLLPVQKQVCLIKKISQHLIPGGKLLFTSPFQKVVWRDRMTGRQSHSLGSDGYHKALLASGIEVISEFDDDSGNHYFSCSKII